MFVTRLAFVLLSIHQTLVWCSPQGTPQVSISVDAPPYGVNQGSAAVASSAGGMNQRPHRSQYAGAQYQANVGSFPIPFAGGLLSSGLGLGSSMINAKTQSASEIMDGVSYGVSRVPAYVGYGVQSAGRLENAGAKMFKAAVDLGTGGLSNGMQGLTMGMNMVNNLGNAGMKGLGKVMSGSSNILEHILSLGATESGLFNTLVALTRLMSPAQGSFLSSGLSMSSLVNAANYLGIPSNNTNLNTIISAAGQLKNSLSSSGITMDSVANAAQKVASAAQSASSATGSVNLASVRQAAASAVQNLGLSTAWDILSSKLYGSSNVAENSQAGAAVQTAASSGALLPVPSGSIGSGVVSSSGNSIGVVLPSSGNTGAVIVPSGSSGVTQTGGESWTSWLG